MSTGQFASEVLDLMGGIGTASFPQLRLAMTQEALYKQLDLQILSAEKEALEESLILGLLEYPAQRQFYQGAENLRLVATVMAAEASPRQWSRYVETVQGQSLAQLWEEQRSLARKAGVAMREPSAENFGQWAELRQECEAFYESALERNLPLVENTLQVLDESGQKTAFLVTGGFHSVGIEELLQEQRISHVVVAPRVTDLSVPTLYLERMLQQEIAPRQTIAFTTQLLQNQGNVITEPQITYREFLGEAYDLMSMLGSRSESEVQATLLEWSRLLARSILRDTRFSTRARLRYLVILAWMSSPEDSDAEALAQALGFEDKSDLAEFLDVKAAERGRAMKEKLRVVAPGTFEGVQQFVETLLPALINRSPAEQNGPQLEERLFCCALDALAEAAMNGRGGESLSKSKEGFVALTRWLVNSFIQAVPGDRLDDAETRKRYLAAVTFVSDALIESLTGESRQGGVENTSAFAMQVAAGLSQRADYHLALINPAEGFQRDLLDPGTDAARQMELWYGAFVHTRTADGEHWEYVENAEQWDQLAGQGKMPTGYVLTTSTVFAQSHPSDKQPWEIWGAAPASREPSGAITRSSPLFYAALKPWGPRDLQEASGQLKRYTPEQFYAAITQSDASKVDFETAAQRIRGLGAWVDEGKRTVTDADRETVPEMLEEMAQLLEEAARGEGVLANVVIYEAILGKESPAYHGFLPDGQRVIVINKEYRFGAAETEDKSEEGRNQALYHKLRTLVWIARIGLRHTIATDYDAYLPEFYARQAASLSDVEVLAHWLASGEETLVTGGRHSVFGFDQIQRLIPLFSEQSYYHLMGMVNEFEEGYRAANQHMAMARYFVDFYGDLRATTMLDRVIEREQEVTLLLRGMAERVLSRDVPLTIQNQLARGPLGGNAVRRVQGLDPASFHKACSLLSPSNVQEFGMVVRQLMVLSDDEGLVRKLFVENPQAFVEAVIGYMENRDRLCEILEIKDGAVILQVLLDVGFAEFANAMHTFGRLRERGEENIVAANQWLIEHVGPRAVREVFSARPRQWVSGMWSLASLASEGLDSDEVVGAFNQLNEIGDLGQFRILYLRSPAGACEALATIVEAGSERFSRHYRMLVDRGLQGQLARTIAADPSGWAKVFNELTELDPESEQPRFSDEEIEKGWTRLRAIVGEPELIRGFEQDSLGVLGLLRSILKLGSDNFERFVKEVLSEPVFKQSFIADPQGADRVLMRVLVGGIFSSESISEVVNRLIRRATEGPYAGLFKTMSRDACLAGAQNTWLLGLWGADRRFEELMQAWEQAKSFWTPDRVAELGGVSVMESKGAAWGRVLGDLLTSSGDDFAHAWQRLGDEPELLLNLTMLEEGPFLTKMLDRRVPQEERDHYMKAHCLLSLAAALKHLESNSYWKNSFDDLEFRFKFIAMEILANAHIEEGSDNASMALDFGDLMLREGDTFMAILTEGHELGHLQPDPRHRVSYLIGTMPPSIAAAQERIGDLHAFALAEATGQEARIEEWILAEGFEHYHLVQLEERFRRQREEHKEARAGMWRLLIDASDRRETLKDLWLNTLIVALERYDEVQPGWGLNALEMWEQRVSAEGIRRAREQWWSDVLPKINETLAYGIDAVRELQSKFRQTGQLFLSPQGNHSLEDVPLSLEQLLVEAQGVRLKLLNVFHVIIHHEELPSAPIESTEVLLHWPVFNLISEIEHFLQSGDIDAVGRWIEDPRGPVQDLDDVIRSLTDIGRMYAYEEMPVIEARGIIQHLLLQGVPILAGAEQVLDEAGPNGYVRLRILRRGIEVRPATSNGHAIDHLVGEASGAEALSSSL
ncbi:MAG: hypothetical protein JW937_06830 [Candidatus Omnitrophica bacterium]|nr:hypothetical protein [Candidatus Omnitrophota bacterium]